MCTALDQVHVLYISPASVEVVYVTGVESMGPGAVSSSPELATSVVKYSTAATGPFQTASGDSSTYVQQYYFPPDVDVPYRSPRIHRVLLDSEPLHCPACSRPSNTSALLPV